MLFDWTSGNVEHVAGHGVTQAEAESVFSGLVLYVAFVGRGAELRRVILGQTTDGRVLMVVYILRGARVRVITAHDTSRKLRRIYLDATQ